MKGWTVLCGAYWLPFFTLLPDFVYWIDIYSFIYRLLVLLFRVGPCGVFFFLHYHSNRFVTWLCKLLYLGYLYNYMLYVYLYKRFTFGADLVPLHWLLYLLFTCKYMFSLSLHIGAVFTPFSLVLYRRHIRTIALFVSHLKYFFFSRSVVAPGSELLLYVASVYWFLLLNSFGPTKIIMQILHYHSKIPNLNTIERFHIHAECTANNHINENQTIFVNAIFDAIRKTQNP